MNHYYIDYMINERKQMEIKECERRRQLKDAGFENSGMLRLVAKKLIGILRTVRNRLRLRKGTFPLHLPGYHAAATRNGEGI